MGVLCSLLYGDSVMGFLAGMKFLVYGLFFVICVTLVLVLIAVSLYRFFYGIRFLLVHRRCPNCKEIRPWKIKQIRSGLYIYRPQPERVTIESPNPVAIIFDEVGNMYTHKYNRICKTCEEKYYVNEWRWPRGTNTDKKLLMRKDEGRSKKNPND